MNLLRNPHSVYNKTVPGIGAVRVIIFLIFHAQLGLMMSTYQVLATTHAYGVLLLGIVLALFSKRPERVAYVSAYMMASEVLWRMNNAQVFWEFTKYAVTTTLFLNVLRRGARKSFLPVLYFLCLVPSIFFHATEEIDLQRSRMLISFNLSGPLALMVSLLFFSKIRLHSEHLRNLLLSIIGPLVSILLTARHHMHLQENIQFVTASMAQTSGGFGANQVSAVLGLGAFSAFLYVMDGKMKFLERGAIGLIGLLFSIQSALTFSRGGLYCAAACIVAASFFMARNRKLWLRYIFVGALLFWVIVQFVIPRLNEFTGGKIMERFKDTGLTNRESLFADDVKIWQEHFFWGVGPGLAMGRREIYAAAHTEFSRMLAEHGLLGLSAIFVLILIAMSSFTRAKTPRQRAFVSSMMLWALLFMTINAMRIAAPSFMFGLAYAYFGESERPKRIMRNDEGEISEKPSA